MTARTIRSRARSVLALVASCSALAACGSSKKSEPLSNTFTLHYHRALGDYAGWKVEVSGGATPASVAASATDGFGAVYTLTLGGAGTLAFTLANGVATDAAGPLTVDVSGAVREAWVFSGYKTAIPRKLPALPSGPNQVVLYYRRGDATYSGWGLHLWGDQVVETSWGAPLGFAGVDAELGAGFVVDIAPTGIPKNCPPGQICLIAHKGDTKDPGPDMIWDRSVLGDIVFLTSGSATLTPVPRTPGSISIEGAGAHLLARDTLAWNVTDASAVGFELRYSTTASITTTDTDVVGGTVIPLTPRPSGIGAPNAAKSPHLAGWRAFDVPSAAGPQLAELETALTGQLVAVARKGDGTPVAATQVQTPFALDDLYAYAGPLGLAFAAGAPTFRLWAPTAQAVKLHVYDAAKVETALVDMVKEPLGVWSYAGPGTWNRLYYRYELTVYHPFTSRIETVLATDPWSASLSTNGGYSQIVDLADADLRPVGWDALAKPPLAAPEDVVIYEGHVRDFSAWDATLAADRRGKYLAFAQDAGATDGRARLAALASAGLTHVHLLPAFDFATVDEDAANRVELDQPFARLCAKNLSVPTALCGQFPAATVREAMATFPGDSAQQQEIAKYASGLDGFNWGYDPVHFGAPEGSYASSAEDVARIVEFRRMVAGLADLGLRVVMDVVYNHTNASGLAEKAVLDKVVPGYYHRRDPVSGFVLTSSCCQNTATEHLMMRRLMVDTLVRWARDYKVDGFRFDLMGLHLKADVLAARDALALLTPGSDGVDGSKLYLYGEGWNMGELKDNARGTNATQLTMAGTGIGTFNDRLRDAVRGGGPFDGGTAVRANQGLASGLYLDPNESGPTGAVAKDKLFLLTDHVKIGMAGNLAAFRFIQSSSGTAAPGGGLGYNGQPTGYAQDPQEVVNYVSAHDNQTLFDILQAKLPAGRTMADRVRMHDLALDVVALGQGIPFFHMGDDLLRSKSLERDSYDAGDWFNRVDWSGQTSAWKTGLPNLGKAPGAGPEPADWTWIRARFADASVAPVAADVAAAAAHLTEMLQVRKSSRLFRLTTGADVLARVDFLNTGPAQVPGVIVMTVTDGTDASCTTPLADLDPARDAVLVMVNADVASHTISVPGATGFTLHPVLAASADPVVRTASVAGDAFTVPARTTAVFEQLQGATRGTGLPCNTH